MSRARITDGYITMPDGSRVKHRYYKKENPRGKILEVGGTKHPWVVVGIDEHHKLSLAPWSWISRVISWNPCNSFELAAGVFD